MSDKPQADRIKELEQEQEKLQSELRKLKRKPEGKIGYLLLLTGIILLTLAIIYSHNVSAFIGIALTFWGALLLYIRPTQFIKKEILDATIKPPQSTHNLAKELGYNGTPTYISPGTLRGLRTATVLIPKTDSSRLPSDERLSQERIIMEDPPALKLIPPGLGLHRLIEEELRTNFSTVDLDYLRVNLERALVEGLEIAESFEMEVGGSAVAVSLRGSIFDNSSEELGGESVVQVGDPLSSALACILARSTRNRITIEQVVKDTADNTTRITFKME